MKRILPLIVLALFTRPALADKILCEFWYHAIDGPGYTNVAPTVMEFNVSLPSSVTTSDSWTGTYTPAQIGQTFDMPTTTFAAWQAVINDPPSGGPWWYASVHIPGVVSNVQVGNGPLDENPGYPFSIGPQGGDLKMFVPRSAWPKLTRITRTINALALNFNGSSASGSGTQTIRIYGVPEPSSLLLIAMGLGILAVRQR